MKKEEIKQELIKRYQFIYENAFFILVPFMCEKENINYPKLGIDSFIYLESLPDELLLSIESFLLSDIKMENSKLYKFMESMKMDTNYLNRYNKGLILLERKNNQYEYEELKLNLDCLYLLKMLYDFISKQSADIKNRDNKLLVVDEYIRINRYKNDGKIWTSGRCQNFKDINNFTNYNYSVIMLENSRKFLRDKQDIGLPSGLFIKYISDFDNHYEYNFSVLSEEEKQEIYLKNHDELPWNLKIKCMYDNDSLVRPDNTRPCFEFFNIKEEEIFINPNSKGYRYYHVCPNCGFIVNIPDNILSEGIKKRIENRCKADPMLFRKMQLYSELYSIDKKVKPGQRKVLKINK